jgi:ABC-2 type transport system permease protein
VSALTIPRLESRGRVTQLRVMRSEWTKLWSVRSTRWSMLIALILTIGFPLLVSAIIASHWSEHSHSNFDPLDPVLVGPGLAQLPIGVLGVLVITAEYSTGMIRASLTAVPKRLPVLWAKVLVFAGTTFALMLPAILIAFYFSQQILSAHVSYSLHHPGVARVVFGSMLYLAFVGAMCVGLGTIVRNTAGSIVLFAAIFFVIPPLLNVLPSNWNNAISQYLPSQAGTSVMNLTHSAHNLRPWPGFAVFVGYTLLTIAVAAVVLKRRDA